MIYLIFALKSEAQAFVDKYKLGRSKSNDNLSIIVSGVGKENMFKASKKIVDIMDDKDTIVNIGICGASHKYEIGELLEVNIPIQSMGTSSAKILTCVDEAVDDAKAYDAVDMESDGFLEATKDMQNAYIFKVVSDHFEPNTVTKEKTKKLIYDKIDEMMLRMQR